VAAGLFPRLVWGAFVDAFFFEDLDEGGEIQGVWIPPYSLRWRRSSGRGGADVSKIVWVLEDLVRVGA